MRVIYIVVFVTLVWLYVCWSCYWAYHEDPAVVTRTISTTSGTTATAIDADVEEANAAGAAAHGAAGRLDPAVLLLLPAFVYSAAAEAAQGGRLECAVCLAEFGDEEKGRTLPGCGHSFHKDCIDVWFGAHSTCPICRAPVELHGGGLEGSEFNV